MPLLLLAIDDHAFPVRRQLCLTLNQPTVRAEAVLGPSPRASTAPDNCAAMFYGTVLHDEGLFRMWYHACHWEMNPDWPPHLAQQFAKYKDPMYLGPTCYAESQDGIHWTRPPLGQVLFKGTTQNNAIALPHAILGGVLVVKDEADADASRRYKMVYQFFPRYSEPPIAGAGNRSSMVHAVSPDGLRWRVLPVPYPNQFIEPAGYWMHGGQHIVGYQAGDGWGAHFSESGHASARQGLCRVSPDFEHWIDGFVESYLVPEPLDPGQRGHKGDYIHNHLGVAAASYGNVCVGLWGRWHNKPVFHEISCDLGLLVSRDGLRFHEPVPGHVWLKSTDSPAAPIDPPLHTNLCQANGILNVGDETRIYHGRWRNTGFERTQDYHGETALATLPRDRWGELALFPNAAEGWCWTEAFTWNRDGASLNAELASGVSVELCDERFAPIGVTAAVRGESGLDLPIEPEADVTGRVVRLKITLRRVGEQSPRVFAVNVK
jgi:hypothetical protein